VRRVGYGAAPDAAAPARALRRAEERGSLWRLFVAVFCMMQVMMYQAPIYFAAPGTLTPDLRTLLLWAANVGPATNNEAAVGTPNVRCPTDHSSVVA